MDDPILEERLKKMFESRAGELPDESLREVRIRKRVYEQIEREETHMKRGFMTSHSDRRDEVHTYEQALKLQEEHGPKVNFPKQFSNGYTFESAVPVNYETSDKDGNKLGKGIHLDITYGKEGMEPITFSAEVGLDGGSAPTDVKTCGDGTELRFYKTVNKFVPANYELTEEDKKAQEAGIFDLAYGSDEIEITTSCMVEWDMDGQGYSLFKFGEELSAEEMFAMAEEIIDAQ